MRRVSLVWSSLVVLAMVTTKFASEMTYMYVVSAVALNTLSHQQS